MSYNDIIKKYSKNNNLKSSDVVAVGDVHGSILQIFYPLKTSGLVDDVNITKQKIKVKISKDYKNCPVVVFLGDYFHKSIFHKSFYLIHILLKIKKVVGDKLILLLGNHDVGQYIFENNILSNHESTNKLLNETYFTACNLEHVNSKIKYVNEFLEAVENGTFKISFVDSVGNFYSHTVINSNVVCNSLEKTEIGFNSNARIFKTLFDSKYTLPQNYNIELGFTIQSNFNVCLKYGYDNLVNYVNYLQDRPFTSKPIDKNEILKSWIYYNSEIHDIAHKSTFHVVGHTPSFRRHPEINLRITEILNQIVSHYDISESLISKLHMINSDDTALHGNILCCDSQALFTSHDISNILLVERKFTKYAIGLRKILTGIYEQPSFYIIMKDNFCSSFDDLHIVDSSFGF